MNRRGFLKTCLTLGIAPAIVHAENIMLIVPRKQLILPDREIQVVRRMPQFVFDRRYAIVEHAWIEPDLTEQALDDAIEALSFKVLRQVNTFSRS